MSATARFTLAIPLLWLAVVVTQHARHVRWLDECQAWLLAHAASSPAALVHALRYEGHPVGWYALLWPFAQLTANIHVLGVLALACAAGFALLVWFRSPFATAEKALLLFGYFVVFEYAIIARSYSLGMLLFALAAMTVARAGKSPWGFALGALANTSLFALAAAGLLAIERLLARRDERRRELVQAGVFAAACVLAIAVMAPAPDVDVGERSGKTFGLLAFLGKASGIARPWVAPIPPWQDDFWTKVVPTPLPVVIALFAILLVSLKGSRVHVLLAAALLGFCVLFGYFVYGIHLRHVGNLWLFVVALWWIQRASAPFDRTARVAFGVIALLHVVGGASALAQHHVRTFSRAADIAAWVTEHAPNATLVFEDDRAAPSVSAYLDAKPVVVLNRLDPLVPITYIEWSKARRPLPPDFLESNLAPLHEEFRDAVFLVVNDRGPRITHPALSGKALVKVASFTGAVWVTENAHLYVFDDGQLRTLLRD